MCRSLDSCCYNFDKDKRTNTTFCIDGYLRLSRASSLYYTGSEARYAETVKEDGVMKLNPDYSQACLDEIKAGMNGPKGCGYDAWKWSYACNLAWWMSDKVLSDYKNTLLHKPLNLGEACGENIDGECHDYKGEAGMCVGFGADTELNYRCAKWKPGKVGDGPCLVFSNSSSTQDLYVTHGAPVEFVYLCDSKTSFCNANTFKCEAKTYVQGEQECSIETGSEIITLFGSMGNRCESIRYGKSCSKDSKWCPEGSKCLSTGGVKPKYFCKQLKEIGEKCEDNNDCKSDKCGDSKTCKYRGDSPASLMCESTKQ